MTDAPRQIPMLFSPEMIRALLAGTKTETRRILEPQPIQLDPACIKSWRWGKSREVWNLSDIQMRKFGPEIAGRCAPGDLIWAKEAHFAYGHWETTDELTKAGKPKRRFVRDDLPVLFDNYKSDPRLACPDRHYA